jgi:hypothetical protein
MSTQLDAIWQQIENLNDADRLVLGQRLHDLAGSQSSKNLDANGQQSGAGWRAVYGAADPSEVAELQQIIDQEFSAIDSEGWD